MNKIQKIKKIKHGRIILMFITIVFLVSFIGYFSKTSELECKESRRRIDQIFLTTTIIKRFIGNKEHGSATGFFFSDTENNVYLVTNKHVIYGEKYFEENAKPEIDTLKIVLHINKDNLSQNELVVIKLFNGNVKIWKEHLQKNIDIVCIPLLLDREKFIFFSIGENALDTSNLKIGFEKIFIMGYPYGWYDTLNNLPITRIGHLSSPLGVFFMGHPFMLGDVETHEGMSGSPVFMHLKDYITIDENNEEITHLGSWKTILLGVFSGQPRWNVKNKETDKIIKIPHSLSIIWFSSLIKEIVAP